MDARKLYACDEISWGAIQVGDWVRPRKWSRCRRVEVIEYENGKRFLFLADPDMEELRKIGLDDFIERATTGKTQECVDQPVWFANPRLRKLWEASAT